MLATAFGGAAGEQRRAKTACAWEWDPWQTAKVELKATEHF